MSSVELTLEQKYALLRAPITVRTIGGRTWAGTTGYSRHMLDGMRSGPGYRVDDSDNYARTRDDK